MVKTIAKKFKRKRRGEAGPLETVIAWGKAAGVVLISFTYEAAKLVQENLSSLKNISPLWTAIIVGAVAMTVIGFVEMRNEKNKGPEPEPTPPKPDISGVNEVQK